MTETSSPVRGHRSARRSAPARAPLVALALLVACSGDDDAGPPEEAPTSATPSSSTSAAPAGEPVRLGGFDATRIELLGGPDWLAADGSFLYVKLDGGRVDRVDPATGAVVASAEIAGAGGPCQGIGVGFDSVWSCDGTDVVRLALEPFEQVATIDAGKAASQGHLATGFDRVWVLQGDGSTLAGIDPEAGVVGDPIPLPVRGHDLAVGVTGIWIVSALDDAVVVIDPSSGAVLHRIDGVAGPTALGITDDAVWVGASDAVHRIDEATAMIEETVEGGIGRDGAVAPDTVGTWVRRGSDVQRIGFEPLSFSLGLDGPSPGDMLVAFGALWTTASEDATLFRIELG